MSLGRVLSSEAHKLRKSCESLIGICAGMLADGELNESEIRFLDIWLRDNTDIACVWPGDVIAMRLRQIMKDGIVTNDELTHLKQTLQDLIGGTLTETGSTSGISSSLPTNDDKAEHIDFHGQSFCFTGNFLFGTRPACEKAVIQRNALVSKTITQTLDYLVVGTMVSKEWANSTFGRKIEKAIDYQRKGFPLLIVSEEHWLKQL